MKDEVFQQILAAYREQAERLIGAARASADGATSDEVKSEGKYDTRSIEASYLAAGQNEQAEAAAEGLAALERYELPEAAETIAAGSLVEVENGGEFEYLFLLPHGGGIQAELHGQPVTVLTPEAPLYEALLGHKLGELVAEQNLMILDVT